MRYGDTTNDKDILDYALPPFAGILREVYDLEDYKQLKLTKVLTRFQILVSQFLTVVGTAIQKCYLEVLRNLDAVLPEEVGSILSPMPINKISFEKSNTGDTDTISVC